MANRAAFGRADMVRAIGSASRLAKREQTVQQHQPIAKRRADGPTSANGPNHGRRNPIDDIVQSSRPARQVFRIYPTKLAQTTPPPGPCGSIYPIVERLAATRRPCAGSRPDSRYRGNTDPARKKARSRSVPTWSSGRPLPVPMPDTG